MARTKDEESAPSSDHRSESRSQRRQTASRHDQDLKAELEYAATSDAAQRLAHAYDLLFRKMGKKQLGAAEEPAGAMSKSGDNGNCVLTC